MDPIALLQQVAESQLGHFSSRQAADLGIDAKRLQRLLKNHIIERTRRGVFRFLGTEVSWRATVAGSLVSPIKGAVASHTTAAALHGLSRAPKLPFPEITVVGSSLPLLKGVGVHRTVELEACDVCEVDGVRATTPARTLIDLTERRMLSKADTVATVDELICHRKSSRSWLHRRAKALRPGRHGVGWIVEVTSPSAQGEFWSMLERATGDLISTSDLPTPRWNVPVRDRSGLIGIVDGLYEDYRVVINLVGLSFHSTPAERSRDADQLNRLQAAGYLVLTFTWEDVFRRPEMVLRRIREALAARVRRPQAVSS